MRVIVRLPVGYWLFLDRKEEGIGYKGSWEKGDVWAGYKS